ncbi:MAG: PqqD family protein [Chloroflexi bacterium]|nr:PqqD family protein [Chloroflexota bacterium]
MNTTIYVNPQLVSEQSEGFVTLLLPQNGMMIVLNETGTVIWQQLVENKSTTEIIYYLMNHYLVSYLEAATDVASFLDQLAIRKLTILH